MKRMLLSLWPSPELRAENAKVEDFNDQLKEEVKTLTVLMKAAQGIGIAAPQAGLNKQIFIASLSGGDKVFINPMVEFIEHPIKSKEGCLSVPGFYDVVDRYRNIGIKFQNEDGESQYQEFEGADAVIVQHELDHLEGIVFVDKMSSFKKGMAMSKVKKLKRRLGWK